MSRTDANREADKQRLIRLNQPHVSGYEARQQFLAVERGSAAANPYARKYAETLTVNIGGTLEMPDDPAR